MVKVMGKKQKTIIPKPSQRAGKESEKKMFEEEDSDDLNDVDLSSEDGGNEIGGLKDDSDDDVSDIELSDDNEENDDDENEDDDDENEDDDDENNDDDDDLEDDDKEEMENSDNSDEVESSSLKKSPKKMEPKKRKAEDNDNEEPPKKKFVPLAGKRLKLHSHINEEELKKSLFLFITGKNVSNEDVEALSDDLVQVKRHKAGFFLIFKSEEKAEENFGVLCRKKINDKYLSVDFLGSKSQAQASRNVKDLLFIKHKLQIRGVPEDTTLKKVQSLFPSSDGVVLATTNKCKGFYTAYISFPSEELAIKAFEDSEGLVINGKEVYITYSLPWTTFKRQSSWDEVTKKRNRHTGRGGQNTFRGGRGGGASPFRGGRGGASPFRGGRGGASLFRGGRGGASYFRGGRGTPFRGFRGGTGRGRRFSFN